MLENIEDKSIFKDNITNKKLAFTINIDNLGDLKLFTKFKEYFLNEVAKYILKTNKKAKIFKEKYNK